VVLMLRRHVERTYLRRVLYGLSMPLRWPLAVARRLLLGAGRRMGWAIDTWRYQRRRANAS
jgi:hypothetical protein